MEMDAAYIERVQRIGAAHGRVGSSRASTCRPVHSSWSGCAVVMTRPLEPATAPRSGGDADPRAADGSELALSVYTDAGSERHVTGRTAGPRRHLRAGAGRRSPTVVRRQAQAMEAASDECWAPRRKGQRGQRQCRRRVPRGRPNARPSQRRRRSFPPPSRKFLPGGPLDGAARMNFPLPGRARHHREFERRIGPDRADHDLIKKIAEGTRLLALNASIEAARRGRRARAFPSSPTKSSGFADQTDDATGNLRNEVLSMQQAMTARESQISKQFSRMQVSIG